VGLLTSFGLWTGVAVVIIGANLGALCSFLLARTFKFACKNNQAKSFSICHFPFVICHCLPPCASNNDK